MSLTVYNYTIKFSLQADITEPGTPLSEDLLNAAEKSTKEGDWHIPSAPACLAAVSVGSKQQRRCRGNKAHENTQKNKWKKKIHVLVISTSLHFYI